MKKSKKKTKGTNVRLAPEPFTKIKNYCLENGYKIGAFVAIASLEKIGND